MHNVYIYYLLGGDSKYVVIQNSKGIQIPLKVVNQPKPATSNIQIVKTHSNVQLLKPNTSTSEGSPTLIQLSPGVNQATTPTKTKFIVKSE